MGTFATDLGMHALHLLLSGSDDLLLNEGGIHGTGGANKRGSAGELCGVSGGEHEGTDGEDCGARSSRVYCMEVAAADFRETDMRQHTLGSTCAPGGMRSVHDTLYNDYCTRRFPATQSVYFSEERCSLLPGVECAS
ncbi:hypothetical protein WJX75_010039 [Coccomyxa subellipsoidea]|uniref:Uncharacterized protein n=1 Tax=Coccomyxa subellipsoidea TaxID=248742 RepID=A0ABR2YFZ0_9CHLO